VGRFTAWPIPGGPAVGLALPVAHRLVGSAILAAAVVLALRVSPIGVVAKRRVGAPHLIVVSRGAR